MSYSIAMVILAAGEGKRLKLKEPKPLAPLLKKRLIDYPVEASLLFLKEHSLRGKVVAVVGHKKEEVIAHLASRYDSSLVETTVQVEQRGTADALLAFVDGISDASSYDYTLVLCADTPMIGAKEISLMVGALKEQNLDAVVASFIAKNPKGYGRILRGKNGLGVKIVEEKDATPDEREICEVNSGFYLFKTSYLTKYIREIGTNNKAGEFYLTDIFALDRKVATLTFENEKTFVGVNDLLQLEQVLRYKVEEKVQELRSGGVFFYDSSSVVIGPDVDVGAGSVIYPNVILEGKTTIGKDSILEAGVIISNSKVASNVVIHAYSHIENSVISSHAAIGPFARLRPDSLIGEHCKVGNFVETKKAELKAGAKVSHLSYVGDAEIGEGANLGCGFITCNYDGASKHFTKIGKECFIGSDCQMIAPVTIGDGSFVAAGSTINTSIPEGSFAISRGRQVTKAGEASRFLKKK